MITEDQFSVYSMMLSQEIERAISSNDYDLVCQVLSYWKNEISWEEIKRRYKTEGSVWIVWWYDGIKQYYDPT